MSIFLNNRSEQSSKKILIEETRVKNESKKLEMEDKREAKKLELEEKRDAKEAGARGEEARVGGKAPGG